MPSAIWITGLPGSGKSTIAKGLLRKLENEGVQVTLLRLDEIREKYVPQPKYTEEERDYVYGKLLEEGLSLIKAGKNIIFDATAHRYRWRDNARKNIKNFAEIYVRCDLDICIKREEERKEGFIMAELYKKALRRKKTGKIYEGLGEVVGVDVPYEESKNVEVIVNSEKLTAEEAAEDIYNELKRREWI